MHAHSTEAAKQRLSKINHDLSVARFAQQEAWDKALNRIDRSITGWAEANMPDEVRAIRDENGSTYLVITGSGGEIFHVADEIAAKLPASKREEIKRAEAQVLEAEDRVKALQAEFEATAAKVAGSPSVEGVGGLFQFGRSAIRTAFDQVRAGQPVKFGALDSTGFPMGAVPDYRLNYVFPYLTEQPVIATLFPIETTDRDSVTVYKQTALASAAAAVAKGGTKPESSPTWDDVNLPIETIAHIATIDNRIAQDFGSWETYVGREMMGGLLRAVDTEVLSGSGVSPHLQGILGAANSGLIGTVERDTSNDPRSKALLQGITYVREHAYTDATVIVIRPDDYEAVLLEREAVYNGSGTVDKGDYLVGGPADAPFDTLYGRRVVVTTALPSHTALVMNPTLAGRLYLRQGATLEVNPWSETEFKKNQLLLRCETRLAFGLILPAAVCEVDLYS